MTTDEVKEILDTISLVFDTIKSDYSKDISDTIRELIKKLTPEVIDILADVLEIKKEKLDKNIIDISEVLNGLDNVFLTDKSDKISAFCQKLKNRPVILKMIAWQLG